MGWQGVYGKVEDILKLNVKMEIQMENGLGIIRMGRNGMNTTISMGKSMEKVLCIMRMDRNVLNPTMSMELNND